VNLQQQKEATVKMANEGVRITNLNEIPIGSQGGYGGAGSGGGVGAAINTSVQQGTPLEPTPPGTTPRGGGSAVGVSSGASAAAMGATGLSNTNVPAPAQVMSQPSSSGATIATGSPQEERQRQSYVQGLQDKGVNYARVAGGPNASPNVTAPAAAAAAAVVAPATSATTSTTGQVESKQSKFDNRQAALAAMDEQFFKSGETRLPSYDLVMSTAEKIFKNKEGDKEGYDAFIKKSRLWWLDQATNEKNKPQDQKEGLKKVLGDLKGTPEEKMAFQKVIKSSPKELSNSEQFIFNKSIPNALMPFEIAGLTKDSKLESGELENKKKMLIDSYLKIMFPMGEDQQEKYLKDLKEFGNVGGDPVIQNTIDEISKRQENINSTRYGKLPKYENGGIVKETGPAIVHKGEYVMSKKEKERSMLKGMSAIPGANFRNPFKYDNIYDYAYGQFNSEEVAESTEKGQSARSIRKGQEAKVKRKENAIKNQQIFSRLANPDIMAPQNEAIKNQQTFSRLANPDISIKPISIKDALSVNSSQYGPIISEKERKAAEEAALYETNVQARRQRQGEFKRKKFVKRDQKGERIFKKDKQGKETKQYETVDETDAAYQARLKKSMLSEEMEQM